MSLTEIAIAHRGGAGLAPENTLQAFSRTYALGLRLLETDVRVTKDGVPLAFHDGDLSRLFGMPGAVRDHTWDELRSLRIGGEPLLRIDDLLDTFTDASFLIDVKDAHSVPGMIAALRRTRAHDRVCVAGGQDRWLTEVSEATGAARALGWTALGSFMWSAKLGIRPPSPLFKGALSAHVPTRLAGMAWMAHTPTAERLVRMARDHRLRLLTWTVNDPAQMRRYLSLGADAVITDRPDLLCDELIFLGRWQPPQPKQTALEGRTSRATVAPASRASASSLESATA